MCKFRRQSPGLQPGDLLFMGMAYAGVALLVLAAASALFIMELPSALLVALVALLGFAMGLLLLG